MSDFGILSRKHWDGWHYVVGWLNHRFFFMFGETNWRPTPTGSPDMWHGGSAMRCKSAGFQADKRMRRSLEKRSPFSSAPAANFHHWKWNCSKPDQSIFGDRNLWGKKYILFLCEKIRSQMGWLSVAIWSLYQTTKSMGTSTDHSRCSGILNPSAILSLMLWRFTQKLTTHQWQITDVATYSSSPSPGLRAVGSSLIFRMHSASWSTPCPV